MVWRIWCVVSVEIRRVFGGMSVMSLVVMVMVMVMC
jgi:hypothetical protein